MKKELRIGIDIGAVTIGLAVLEAGELVAKAYRYHHGAAGGTLAKMRADFRSGDALVGFTGRGAKAFDPSGKINDVVATLKGVKWASRSDEKRRDANP
jgi:hypothetical protein